MVGRSWTTGIAVGLEDEYIAQAKIFRGPSLPCRRRALILPYMTAMLRCDSCTIDAGREYFRSLSQRRLHFYPRQPSLAEGMLCPETILISLSSRLVRQLRDRSQRIT